MDGARSSFPAPPHGLRFERAARSGPAHIPSTAAAELVSAVNPAVILRWLRANLFSSWPNALATLAALWLLWRMVPPFIDWAFLDAIWQAPDSKACRAAAGEGACWAFIAEKHRFILFGTYPYEQHWRPALACAVLVALWVMSALRWSWGWRLAPLWAVGLAVVGVLMWGGVPGLPYVENERWGGLILTLLLTTFGLAIAFPLSILLALGRRSGMPLIQGLCVGFIELIQIGRAHV